MWEALIPAAVSLFSGFMGSESQEDTNYSNQQIAQRNTEFNEAEAARTRQFNAEQAGDQRAWSAQQADYARAYMTDMSNTSYQRGVKDMQAAGLNPMLAYSQGGASTPNTNAPSGANATGSAAQAANPAPMQNKWAAGANAAAAAAQVMNTQANTRVQESQAKVNEVEARKKEQEIDTTIASAGQYRAHTDNIRQEMQSFEKRMEKLAWEVVGTKEASLQQVIETIQRQRHHSENFPELQRIQAEIRRIQQDARKLSAEASIRELDIPKAINDAAFEAGAYGPYRPYVQHGSESIGRLFNSASQAKRAFSPVRPR